METVDLKDRKILYQLDLDCRQSNTQIGKKVGLSRKVVDYRIKRMEEEGIITGYWTAIDTLRLGYYSIRVYINFLDVEPMIKKEILDYFSRHTNIWAILDVKGPIDLDVIFWVDDIYEFNRFWDKTLELYGKYFLTYTISILTKATCLKKTYLLKDKLSSDRIFYITSCRGQPIQIDSADYQLLNEVVNNARISLVELSQRMELSSQTLTYRLNNLLKKGVIQAFRVGINLKKIGLHNCSIDIYLKSHDKKKAIIDYFTKCPNVEYIMDMAIGWADIDAELMVEKIDTLNEIVEDIDKKYPHAVRKSNFWMTKKVIKERWLPDMKPKNIIQR